MTPLPPMHDPPLRHVIKHPTPRLGDNLPFHGPTEETEQEYKDARHAEDDSESPPVALDREFGALKVHGKVARHQCHGHEEDGDFGEEEGYTCETFHAEGLFDGD